MLAWPICVASYGVIPQTYMRAVPLSGPIGTSSRLAVSKACSRCTNDDAGSVGNGRELQACMASHYPATPSLTATTAAMPLWPGVRTAAARIVRCTAVRTAARGSRAILHAAGAFAAA